MNDPRYMLTRGQEPLGGVTEVMMHRDKQAPPSHDPQLCAAFSTPNAAPRVLAPGPQPGHPHVSAWGTRDRQGWSSARGRSGRARSWARNQEQLQVHHGKSPETPLRARTASASPAVPGRCCSPRLVLVPEASGCLPGGAQHWVPTSSQKERAGRRGVFGCVVLVIINISFFFFWH